MCNFLHKCNGDCKLYMLLLIGILCFLLYQCYNKSCSKEGFYAMAGEGTQGGQIAAPVPVSLAQFASQPGLKVVNYIITDNEYIKFINIEPKAITYSENIKAGSIVDATKDDIYNLVVKQLNLSSELFYEILNDNNLLPKNITPKNMMQILPGHIFYYNPKQPISKDKLIKIYKPNSVTKDQPTGTITVKPLPYRVGLHTVTEEIINNLPLNNFDIKPPEVNQDNNFNLTGVKQVNQVQQIQVVNQVQQPQVVKQVQQPQVVNQVSQIPQFNPSMVKNGIISGYNSIPPMFEEAPYEDVKNLFTIFNIKKLEIINLRQQAGQFPFGYLYLDIPTKPQIIRSKKELLLNEVETIRKSLPPIFQIFEILLPSDILTLLANNKVSTIKALKPKLSCQYIVIDESSNRVAILFNKNNTRN
jgi:hypothetical protein